MDLAHVFDVALYSVMLEDFDHPNEIMMQNLVKLILIYLFESPVLKIIILNYVALVLAQSCHHNMRLILK